MCVNDCREKITGRRPRRESEGSIVAEKFWKQDGAKGPC
jgi:hypothetical protein